MFYLFIMNDKCNKSLSSLLLLFICQSLLFVLIFNNKVLCSQNDDYYQLLGVTKDADNRDIRKAFKKLALTQHPDKNQNDPNSHEKFLRITRAYEVLKDEEMRKKYDMFGEEGLKDDLNGRNGGQYHSWNYYNDDFGIYDNDEEIITLSKMDFEQSVRNSAYIWFINFYSPQCSHCHHLAPDWRKLAKELDGTIRIGAVNCEEDWMLCRSENIRSYPSLIFYPDREKYTGQRDTDSMVEFVLSKLKDNIIKIDKNNLKTFHALSPDSQQNEFDKPSNYWLLIFCFENKDCLFSDTRKKLSVMLERLVNVAEVDCDSTEKSVCEHFAISESKIALFQNIKEDQQNYLQISSGDASVEAKEIFNAVLAKLPNIRKLSHKDIKALMEDLNNENTLSQPWIIQFTTTEKDIESHQIEMKRLISLLPEVNIGKVYCDKESKACSQFYIQKYPSFVVIKSNAVYEIYHGRILAYDIVTFAKESLSSQLQTLDPNQFENKVVNSASNADKPWLVDFFAPWCPPCMHLLPEIRKASRSAHHLVNFGTIDCTIHSAMCRKLNIRSYPTVLLYNSSIPHQFHGSHSEGDLIEFINEILYPTVINLNPSSFTEIVEKRKSNTIFLVDFFAPWCGPCQRLSPQWTKLAKLLKDEPNVSVGQVDCQAYSNFCSQHGVRSYPTIRLYPSKSGQYKESYYSYNGNNRDATSLRVWAYNFITSVVKDINSDEVFSAILRSKNVWLIDYYAPWCSHCQTFSPEFELIAKKLKSKVRAAKVNCQNLPHICREADITAYPTVKLYVGTKDKIKQNPEGIHVEGYNSEHIIDFVLDHLSSINEQSNLLKDEL